jgi:Ca-activated chloride channel family protein
MTFTRSQYAMAASLAALIIAAPIAFRVADMPRYEETGEAIQKPAPEITANQNAAADKPRTDALTERGRLEAEKKLRQVPPPASTALTAVPGTPRAGNVGPESSIAGLASPSAAPAATATRRFGPMQMGGGISGAINTADADRRRVVADEGFRDQFEATSINPLKQVASEPVSTFSIDVDTASYAFVRRALNAGRLPPKAAVRTEEMINYFDYAYPSAESVSAPFKPTVTVVPSPWNPSNRLVHIGIKGYELQNSERPRANLVLLVDVSGSMQPADKLPLVKNGLRMLVEELKPDDTVALVTYASGSSVVLEPTKVSEKSKILSAIEQLGAGGSTAGAAGIQDAYRLAEQSLDKDAVNRVILATDGDFNVGITDREELKGFIERKRDKGIYLSILGVGRGNYTDRLMQTLAQNGNGVAAYADTLGEARKVLVEEASSTLFPIAKDVKIQVEWNPARVSEYRLIGYETRALKQEDFNNDKVDAGDIGSGHAVTAIYEITPAGTKTKLVDDLRYGKPANEPTVEPAGTGRRSSETADEIGFLKMRFKLPKSDMSAPLSLAITDAMVQPAIESASADVRFSVAVAGFSEILRGSPYLKSFAFDDVVALATLARGEDPFGQRNEFLSLVRLAKSAQP